MNTRSKSIFSKSFFVAIIIALSLCNYTVGSALEGEEEAKPVAPEPVKILVPVSVNLGDYRKLNIEVYTEIDDAIEYVPAFKSELSKKIEEKKLFAQIPIVKDSSHDVLLKAKIVEFHKASNWRFLMGFAAGLLIDSSKGTADIELIDIKTNKVIGSFRAKAKGQTISSVFEDMADSIVAFLKEAKEKPPVQTVTAPKKTETTTKSQGDNIEAGTSIEKLDKLRKDGVISEDEYKRAKGKITPAQTDNSEINNKLQELSELHKNGVLSAEDYNKAKKRLTELHKLNELRQSGILTEDEYNKAKSRLMDK